MENSRKKVYFYTDSLAMGGAEKVSIYLAEYFSKEGINAQILTNKVIEKEYQINNTVRHSIFDIHEKYSKIKNIIRLFRFIKSEKPSAIVVLGTPLLVYLIPILLFLKVKVIVSERNSPEQFKGKRLTKQLSNVLIKYVDGCVFQTTGAKEYYSYVKTEKVVIPNPIYIDRLPLNENLEKSNTIVNVGRLNIQKNQEMLIKAFKKIAPKFPEYQLIIYGEGPERRNLEKLVSDLNLHSKVLLPGSTTKILQKINKSKLFVLSSNFEGMPNALIEAMSLGLPVISTDCPSGGPSDLISEGENGLLVKVDDSTELAAKMKFLLENPDYAETLGENAKNIRERLNAEKIGSSWKTFYENVVRK